MTVETLTIPGISKPASRIGLGTWAIGGWMWGGSDESEAVRTIQAAVEQGINLIDTAPVYGFGKSEKIVGEALAGGLRERALIATKVALNWRSGNPYRDASARRINQEIEDSLRRLRTDHIDLYQVHWPDPLTAIEETASALAALQKQGKVLAIGVSNFSPAQMDAFRAAAPLATVQPPYNLFERAIDEDVLPYAEANGLVTLCYGALCRGLLSGRITGETMFSGDDLRRIDPKFQEPRRSQYLAAVAELDTYAREHHGKTVLALAVRWVLDRGRTIALWGARRVDQLKGMQEVFGWKLTEGDMREIDAIVARHVHDPIGPEFMAPPTKDKVLGKA
jgi:aryl-alcohol dehydrogenase-like predicted oxidoreductase